MASDINSKNVFIAKTPAKFHPYIQLARLDRPIGIWLLLFPCWISAFMAINNGSYINKKTLFRIALFAPGALLMRAAGCVMNDLWDRKLDAQVARTCHRPLASGTLSSRQAFIFLLTLLVLSFFILLSLGKPAMIWGLLSVPFVIVYPLMKRITWWPQAFLGITFNWGVLIADATVRETFAISHSALILYVGCIFWTLAYDTIYAHQDIEDDAVVGIKSTARLFAHHSKRVVGLFYILALILIGTAQMCSKPLGLAILPILGIYTFNLLHRWNPSSAGSSLAAFKANFGWGGLALLMAATKLFVPT